MAFRPGDPLTVLRGVGDKLAARLRQGALATIRDLLLSFPRRHAEVDTIDGPVEEALHRLVRIRARVLSTRLTWLPGRRSMVTVRLAPVADGAGFEVRFFNQPYLKRAHAAGTVRLAEGLLVRRGAAYLLEQGRLLPAEPPAQGPCLLTYGEIPGISGTRFAGLVGQALRGVDLAGWDHEELPAELAADLPGFPEAVRAMHQPGSIAEHERARLRFAVAEAVGLFRRVESSRRRRRAQVGPVIDPGGGNGTGWPAVLPFELTADQRRARDAVLGWMSGASPMGALLQGDVGSGKTAVAVCAAQAAVASGHQVAFLAPTALLAEQHRQSAGEWLRRGGVPVELLTGSQDPAARSALLARLAGGGPCVVFGTHALFSARTCLPRLGLAIIDEQHRFGVAQRLELLRKGGRRHPHVLYMTATPIPRTLTYTVFGDLDLALIRERPPGHRDVPAFYLAADPQGWRRILGLIGRRLRRGQQVMVVCPKVGADGERGGAVRMHAELSRRFDCGLVHGRLDPEARQATLAAFRAREFGVLVGTTVLEVGVDVPNATLMVVTGADRFGLSTLHQLRGRVGRGRRRGICVLTGAPGPRLDAVCATADGFALAERDLALRGAGELLGTRQSGLSDLRALDPVRDVELLRRVRAVVRREGIAGVRRGRATATRTTATRTTATRTTGRMEEP